MTIKVEFDRLHLSEGQAAGPVHAPLFPTAKFEEWWVLVVEPENGMVICHEKVKSLEKTFSANLKFRLGSPGQKKFQVHVMSDSYAGIDRKLEVQFMVQKEKPFEIFVHPEDADLDKHPTLFQQMVLAAAKEEEEEEDEDEEEEEKAADKKQDTRVEEISEDDD